MWRCRVDSAMKKMVTRRNTPLQKKAERNKKETVQKASQGCCISPIQCISLGREGNRKLSTFFHSKQAQCTWLSTALLSKTKSEDKMLSLVQTREEQESGREQGRFNHHTEKGRQRGGKKAVQVTELAPKALVDLTEVQDILTAQCITQHQPDTKLTHLWQEKIFFSPVTGEGTYFCQAEIIHLSSVAYIPAGTASLQGKHDCRVHNSHMLSRNTSIFPGNYDA